jgi:glycosyltransferase involved in cell wall biosynthesis
VDFVIMANAWTAAADNPTSKHQIAMELVRRGHRVLWVVGAGMRSPSLGSGADRGRILRKLRQSIRPPERVPLAELRSASGALWVVAPLLIPLPKVALVRRLNGILFHGVTRFWAWRLKLAAPVLINYVPVLADVMRRWRGRVVYHCVDRWDQFAMYDRDLMRKMDAACRQHADTVIATSRDLYDLCRADHGNVHLINHGVSFDHFASALQDGKKTPPFPHRGGAVVGFFGLLSEWVDQDLIIALAKALPEADVVLIGSADVDVSALKAQSNIHVLGPKPFADLPAAIAHFDVGIIPFVVNELTRAVNPIKLREMLAAGCPVVSTALPEVSVYTESLPQAVRTASSSEGFVEAVKDILSADADPHAVSACMRSETWTAKVDEILNVIENTPSDGRP